tara:strand:+ start:22557 stop:23207 length:651 start_codon:yes stop_codon:yes gene_type:complete
MDKLLTQIEETLRRSVCTGWDRSFLESIHHQLEKGKVLTAKQKSVLGRVLSQNTEVDEKHMEGWKEEYYSKHASEAMIAAYYHLQHPYYQCQAEDILNGRVPRRKHFIKMMNNKHTQKVLRESKKHPRFKAGTYVRAKTNFDRTHMSFSTWKDPQEKFLDWDVKRRAFLDFGKKGGLIIGIDQEIHSAAKGAKRYKILAIGCALPFYVEERFLKYG